MKKFVLVIGSFFLLIHLVFSQAADTLSLKFCYKLAIDNYPLSKQKELLPEISSLKIENINAGFLPQMTLNGQATYQSHVTEIPLSAKNIQIPSLYKDMYKAVVDVNQVIYDGGIMLAQKKVEQLSLQADKQNLDVQLFQLKQRINQLFLSILVSKKSKRILELQKDDITANLAKIKAGVKYGTIIKSNEDVLKAELIRIDMQIIEINEGISASYKMLGELTGKEINPNIDLLLPEINDALIKPDNIRPEMALFDIQQNVLNAGREVISSQRNPRIYGFGEAGYGRPGLNMLSNKFDTFWLIGGKFTWNIWDWNSSSRQKQIVELQKSIIVTQKETFDKNLKVSLNAYIADINKYSEMIKKDGEMISIRQEILKSASSQLQNGVITSTDFVIQVNDLAVAMLNLESHKLQLAFAKINYITALGN